ncbi:hypothetical protein, partial [Halobacillus trueperi]
MKLEKQLKKAWRMNASKPNSVPVDVPFPRRRKKKLK